MAGMTRQGRRNGRRGLLAALAGVGMWTVCLSGLAPTAVAQDVQSQQWYLKAMQAKEMWKVSTGTGVKVAVVDSGVDSSMPSLRGQVLSGEDVSRDAGGTETDVAGHGTSMAELIAGTGRSGSLKGLAPNAKIIPIRVGLAKKLKNGKTRGNDFASGIRAAADTDAQIINMSASDVAPGPDLEDAVKYATRKGKLLLAAAGNDGEKANEANYPAASANAVSIAATDESGKVADFSNSASSVDLSAPGTSIPGWCDEARKRYCSGDGGTSAATALASASAALIWSKHPDWTANQVLRVLIDTAGRKSKNSKPSKYIGYGSVRPRINLLEGKGDPGDPEISPLTDKKLGPSVKKKVPDDSANADGAPDKVKVADSSSDGEGGSGVLPVVGVGAGVVVLVGGGLVFARVRRKSHT